MAAVVAGVATAHVADQASYVSGSFTPADGDLLVAFVTTSGKAVAGSLSDSQSLGWTAITSALKNTSADICEAFVSNRKAAASSMTVTYTVGGVGNATGCVIQVARVSAAPFAGALAIKQSAVQANQAAGTPAPVFGAAAVTTNPTLGLVGNSTNPATMTAPTSWTERSDTGYATPATGAEYVTRDSGFTGTTVTWGNASATAFASIIVEIDVSTLVGLRESQIVAEVVYLPDVTSLRESQIVLEVVMKEGLLDSHARVQGRFGVFATPEAFPTGLVPARFSVYGDGTVTSPAGGAHVQVVWVG